MTSTGSGLSPRTWYSFSVSLLYRDPKTQILHHEEHEGDEESLIQKSLKSVRFFMPFMCFMVQLQLLECLTTIIHTIDQKGWRNIGLRCEWHLLKQKFLLSHTIRHSAKAGVVVHGRTVYGSKDVIQRNSHHRW